MMRKITAGMVGLMTFGAVASAIQIQSSLTAETSYQDFSPSFGVHYDRASKVKANIGWGNFNVAVGAMHHYWNIGDFWLSWWTSQYGLKVGYKTPYGKIWGGFTYVTSNNDILDNTNIYSLGYRNTIKGINTEIFGSYWDKNEGSKRWQLTAKLGKTLYGYETYIRIDAVEDEDTYGNWHTRGFGEIGVEREFSIKGIKVKPALTIGAGDGYQIQRGLFVEREYTRERFTGKLSIEIKPTERVKITPYVVYREATGTNVKRFWQTWQVTTTTKGGWGGGIAVSVAF